MFSLSTVKTGLHKGQQHTQEILKARVRKRAKTENMEIVLNGHRKASVREDIRAASSTI